MMKELIINIINENKFSINELEINGDDLRQETIDKFIKMILDISYDDIKIQNVERVDEESFSYKTTNAIKESFNSIKE